MRLPPLFSPPSEGQPGMAAAVFVLDASRATVITGLPPHRAGPSGLPGLTVRTLTPMITQGPADDRAWQGPSSLQIPPQVTARYLGL